MNTSLPILTFHSIDDARNVLSFRPRLFERGIATLSQLGYRAISVLDAVACLRRGASFPERTCVITFDDGYASTYVNAFPILQQFNFTATIFLTVGGGKSERLPTLNGRARLSWHEIREMHRHGIAFGAHTLTHPDLTRLAAKEIETEMRESKNIIAQTIGAEVATFAYPFGKFNSLSRAIAQKYFAGAVSDRLGLVRTHNDPFALERVDAYYLQNEKIFGLMPTHWFEAYLLARRLPRNLRQRFLR